MRGSQWRAASVLLVKNIYIYIENIFIIIIIIIINLYIENIFIIIIIIIITATTTTEYSINIINIK